MKKENPNQKKDIINFVTELEKKSKSKSKKSKQERSGTRNPVPPNPIHSAS